MANIKGNCHLGPQCGLHPKHGQGHRIHGDFLPTFGRPAYGGLSIAPGGAVVVHPTQLSRRLGKDAVRGKAAHCPQACLLDLWMAGDGSDLLFIYFLERPMVVPARLPEVVGFIAFRHRHGNGKEGGKQQGRQSDGQHRDEIPLSGGPQGFQAQLADAGLIFDIHILTPLFPGDDPSVFDADDPVGHLGDFLVVGDHDNGLGELLAGDL